MALKKNGVKKLFDKIRDFGGEAWRPGIAEIDPSLTVLKVTETKRVRLGEEERVRKVFLYMLVSLI